MRVIARNYTISTADVMTEDGPGAVGPSWTAGGTTGPEFSGRGLRSWSLVMEGIGAGTFDGVVTLQYKLDDGDAWTSYRSIPTHVAIGARMHHMTTAGTFFETTGQTWLPVSAIRILPETAGGDPANSTCRLHFRAEYVE